MAYSGANKGLSHNVRGWIAEDDAKAIRQLNQQLEQEGFDLARQLGRSQLEMDRQVAAMDNWARAGVVFKHQEPLPTRGNYGRYHAVDVGPAKVEPEKPSPTHHEDGKPIGWLAELGAEYERRWG